MKVRAKDNIHDERLFEKHYRNLRPNHDYTVLGIDSFHYRVFNENFEPILYPKEIFDVVEGLVPSGWVREEFPDGDYYVDPPELAEPGLYGDFFDGDIQAINTLMNYLVSTGIVSEEDWWKKLIQKRSSWARCFIKAMGKQTDAPG